MRYPSPVRVILPAVLSLAILAACQAGSDAPSAKSPADTGDGSPPEAGPSPTTLVSRDEPGRLRAERTYDFEPPWVAQCDRYACDVPYLFALQVKTPLSAPKVDVSLTLTLDYETKSKPSGSQSEPNDRGSVAAFFADEEHENGPFTDMEPGGFLLQSPALDTPETATYSWAKEEVKAAGRVYFFRASVVPIEGEPIDDFALITGSKATVIVEMWPSGS